CQADFDSVAKTGRIGPRARQAIPNESATLVNKIACRVLSRQLRLFITRVLQRNNPLVPHILEQPIRRKLAAQRFFFNETIGDAADWGELDALNVVSAYCQDLLSVDSTWTLASEKFFEAHHFSFIESFPPDFRNASQVFCLSGHVSPMSSRNFLRPRNRRALRLPIRVIIRRKSIKGANT